MKPNQSKEIFRDMESFNGGLGSIEPFIESVPQTFIQTGFFVLGNSSSMKMLEIVNYKLNCITIDSFAYLVNI